MVGAPFEDTVAALQLLMSGVTSRYPRIQVIVPHLGGTLPFLLERIDGNVGNRRARGGPVPFEGSASAAPMRRARVKSESRSTVASAGTFAVSCISPRYARICASVGSPFGL